MKALGLCGASLLDNILPSAPDPYISGDRTCADGTLLPRDAQSYGEAEQVTRELYPLWVLL